MTYRLLIISHLERSLSISECQLTPGVVFSEIYQVTGPVERFASNIASEGYVVALPSSFHEFEGPEPIPYDTEGTDRGNKYKVSYVSRREADCQIEKTVEAYDEVCSGPLSC